jgi:hypothetical protein
MATIILGTYMVRYPLGGNLSWALQYLVGLKDLGHDVYAVEKYVHPDSCYDPVNQKMSNDCSYGVKVVGELMARYGLGDNWCFVEFGEIYHGMSKAKINDTFRRADLYIENGAHGVWKEEVQSSPARTAYIDVDPAFTQFKFYRKINAGLALPHYDMYFTNGMNVGKEGNIIPVCNIQWHYIFNPVRTTLFEIHPPAAGAAYSTIMNWVSYKENVVFQGVTYGHKSMEFDKFLKLPDLVDVQMELAMSGLDSKQEKETIRAHGWNLKNAQEVTFSIDSFRDYLLDCRGEFSVVKNMYCATNSGWFSDKSAAFMASGRPVVLQETGFSDYLPVGEGLFAVNNMDEAKDAIESIESNYDFHSKRAYEIANEYLEAKKVLKQFLNELGIN